MMPEPRVSLVLVNWNQKDLLRRALLSIRSHAAAISHEVIAVDNASTDGSQEMVRTEFPDAILIAKSDNRGYGQALNSGMRQSRGEFVFLLNNDMVLLPETMQHLISFMERHPDAGVIGCRFFTDMTCTTVQPSAFRVYPTPWNDLVDRIVGQRLRRAFPRSEAVRRVTARWDRTWTAGDRPAEVASVVGAAMMTRREVVEQELFFDEQFYMFLEETDWCRRVRNRGWKIYHVPGAAIVHVHGGSFSTPELRRARDEMYYESYVKYLRKHESWLAVGFAHAVHTMSRARQRLARG